MKEIKKHPITKGYKNPYLKKNKRTVFDWVGFAVGAYKDLDEKVEVPEDFVYPQKDTELKANNPKVTWVNHCTFLIEHNGFNMLTDPIWSHRCSPVSFAGPKRQHEPGIDLNALPDIHMVLISHNHFDHLDRQTVLYLKKKFPEIFWMVPKGVKRWFKTHGIHKVAEFSWWEHLTLLNNQVKVTAVPAQHFSGRHLMNLNQTLWSGFVVEFLGQNKKVYFVGDTGYNPVQFKQIGERFGHMDLSLIPIGTYSPREFMGPVHIAPVESVHIHRDVGSKLSVGSHFKTFNLSIEGDARPPFDLYRAMEEAELDHNTFRVLQPGQTINW